MFRRLSNSIAQFMWGRYGTDQLNRCLFWVYFVVWVVSLFFRRFVWGIAFAVVLWSVLGWMLFRMLSRNIPRRRRENAAFRRFFFRLSLPARRLSARWKSRKTHIFRKCPHCRATLRLARIPGEHVVKCPACAARFSVRVKK